LDFIKDLHEARMTRDMSGAKKLTYTDCCERLYLTLLAMDVMRQYPDFEGYVQRYARKTAGFELYKYYRVMGTDLYNFIYFVVGDESAQDKLKDPDAAKSRKKKTRVPVMDLNRYINGLKNGIVGNNVSGFFIKLESGLGITNSDYKFIRRNIASWNRLNLQEKQRVMTRLIYAIRAKLRSSDFIEDFEKFAAYKDLETTNVKDPEPTVSVPDIGISPEEISMYRYLVGDKNLAATRRFLQSAKNGQAASSSMIQGYLPAIKMLDDIVNAGPAYVQNLRTLHKRAKNRKN
jgi:hypothetical protein